jgi:hypothetical protein
MLHAACCVLHLGSWVLRVVAPDLQRRVLEDLRERRRSVAAEDEQRRLQAVPPTGGAREATGNVTRGMPQATFHAAKTKSGVCNEPIR